MGKHTGSAYKMFQGNPLGVRKRNYRAHCTVCRKVPPIKSWGVLNAGV